MNRRFFVAAALVAMVLAAIGVFGVQTAAAQSLADQISGLVTRLAKRISARTERLSIVASHSRFSTICVEGEC